MTLGVLKVAIVDMERGTFKTYCLVMLVVFLSVLEAMLELVYGQLVKRKKFSLEEYSTEVVVVHDS